MSESFPLSAPPWTIRAAGVLVAVEGLVALVGAAVFLVRAVSGTDDAGSLGYGAAAGFAVLGLAVGSGGVALALGQRWGRAMAVVAQLLLLPVVYSLLTDSHQPGYGTGIGLVAVLILGLLFCAPSAAWLAHEFGEERSAADEDGPTG